MKQPQMILFDYGSTLVYEAEWNLIDGLRALWKHLARNPHNMTPEEAKPIAMEALRASWEVVHMNIEIPDRNIIRGALRPYGIEFDLNDDDLEELYLNSAIPGRMVPEADALLRYCRENGIRTAVVSNLAFDGVVLERRLRSIIPDHTFEAIYSSANYCFRKPHPAMFRAALEDAGLAPTDVWYCGDDYAKDIESSHALGMFPVWIETGLPRFYQVSPAEIEPPFDCLRVKGWNEVIETLKHCEKR